MVTKEEAKAEVAMLIDETLREYVSKTMGIYAPPRWEWTYEYPFFYNPPNRTIYVSEPVSVWWWMRDKEKAKKALRYALGHEFWHYVQDVRGEWRIRVPILAFPGLAEYIAQKHAVRLSGVGTLQFESIVRELMVVPLPT
jgi:hypothetical protein